jgi:hypothetical protein
MYCRGVYLTQQPTFPLTGSITEVHGQGIFFILEPSVAPLDPLRIGVIQHDILNLLLL